LLEIVGERSDNQRDKNFDKGFSVTSLKSGKDFDLKQEVEIGPRKKKR